MDTPYSKLFHAGSKEHRGPDGAIIPTDTDLHPREWKTTYFKDYPRFEKIALPHEMPRADFFELVRARKSGRDYAGKPLTKSQLSAILQYSCGITEVPGSENSRRAQPSAGARYPIEIYPLVFSGSGEIPAGLYHYNVRQHALDVLWERPFTAGDIGDLFSYEYVREASAAIVLTAAFERTQMKYGERGYRYILLEAGHIGQGVYLSSQAVGFHCCATGTWDKNLENLLDVDGFTESVVYALALG